MRNKKTGIKVLSFILSAIMLISSVSIFAFAADADFYYFFTDDAKTSIALTGFKGEIPEDGIVEIPETIDGFKVVRIAEHTFDNESKLKGIIIPEGVTIDEDAFYGCTNIISVQIKGKSEDVEIGDDVFDATKWYEDHAMDYVFAGDSTLLGYKGDDEIVTIPYNCTTIANGAFKNNTTIKTVYLTNGLTKIGDDAFSGCTSLENIIPAEKTGDMTIGSNAFYGTPWLKNFPSTFVTLGTTLVKYKGNASYVIVPNVITSIAAGAFTVDSADDGVAFKIKVPKSVQSFGKDCFLLYTSASPVYPAITLYSGSKAQDYCDKEGLKYSLAALYGDADLDGKVTAADARYVLRVSAKLENPQLASDVKEAADITKDGKITAEDARLILRISAKLATFSEDELQNMPSSAYETLLLVSKAITSAKAYGCAYSKTAYQSITSYNMNTNTQTYLNQFKKELTSESKAQTVTYAEDSQEALDNLSNITLIDDSKVKSYTCSISDGVYNIKIVLNDETVNCNDTAATSTAKMFPVESAAHFTNKIKNEYWYKLKSTNFGFDMTYKDCTLEMQVAVDTLQIKTITMNMTYYFSINGGKIVGIPITNKAIGGSSGANATRQDTVKYTNFAYFTK